VIIHGGVEVVNLIIWKVNINPKAIKTGILEFVQVFGIKVIAVGIDADPRVWCGLSNLPDTPQNALFRKRL